MGCPKRFIVVAFGFVGLLVSIGYRAVFALVMVNVIKPKGSSTNAGIFKNCTVGINDTTDLSLEGSVTVEFSQLMNTAYFVGSLVTQAPGGYLSMRFSPSRMCGLSIFLSSALMLFLPLSIPFNKYLTLVIRLVQGLVEGVSVPALNGVISAWAPKSEKTRMVTISYAGAYLSPAIAFLATGSTSCYVSWHSSLYIYGGLGVLWSLAWFIFVYDTPAGHPNLEEKEKSLFEREGPKHKGGNKSVASNIPWRGIFTSLPVYAIIVASFCRNWIFSMIITELPLYFQDVFKVNIADNALMAGAPEVFMTIVTVTGGVLIDQLIKAKNSKITTTFGRKFAQCTGFGIEAICVFALTALGDTKQDQGIALILLCVGVGFSGLAISGYQVNPIDLSPQYSSLLTGLSRCGALGAILSTVIAAKVRGNDAGLHKWKIIFWIAGSVHMAGVLFYGIFADGSKQAWAETKDGERKPLVSPVEDPNIEYARREHIYSRSAEYWAIRSPEYNTDDLDTIFSKSENYTATRKTDDDDEADWFLLTI